jgi:secreted trypsin-like serine protease
MHYTEDGEIDFAPRIIGGVPSFQGDFPAKVSLQTRAGAHFCGGALIGDLLSFSYRLRSLSMNL